MTNVSASTYQVIYTQRKDRNVHQARVTANDMRLAKAAFHLGMNHRGCLRMDIKILSLIVADTLEAGQALVAAQAVQDIVDAKAALKSQSKATLDAIRRRIAVPGYSSDQAAYGIVWACDQGFDTVDEGFTLAMSRILLSDEQLDEGSRFNT